ncbi:hypothetical protein QBC45DRAFT_397931 [Copromyces sp. CBS 386.78]|nr:hypothetical protein QBC45DRAFT_397931 [Copromyces sp. CBS 386.78]
MYRPKGATHHGVSTPATTVPPTHVEILGRHTAHDLRDNSIPAVAAASERFFSDFVNGEFAQMKTDSVYRAAGIRLLLMCGFYAIINSFQDLKRHDKRVRVPKFEELLDVLRNEAAARFLEYGLPHVPYNEFSIDELRVILDEWVKKYWPSCPFGGVRLGVVSRLAPSQLRISVRNPNAAAKKLLAPQLPISDPAPTGLPDLVVWIANLEGDHWEGMAQVIQEREEQVLPQMGRHDPHAMQSPIQGHLFHQGQLALPGFHPISQPSYSPHQPSPSPTSEVQIESLRGGCPSLGEQRGRCAEPPCPPPSAPTDRGQFSGPGGSQDFPTTWWSPPPPIQGVVAHLRGQRQRGGREAPLPHVQLPMRPAGPKRRVRSEVEEDKSQEQEKPAKKRRNMK